MTTVSQGDLPKDPDVLRTIVQQNAGNVGVLASVIRGGRIRAGMRWRWSEPGSGGGGSAMSGMVKMWACVALVVVSDPAVAMSGDRWRCRSTRRARSRSRRSSCGWPGERGRDRSAPGRA